MSKFIDLLDNINPSQPDTEAITAFKEQFRAHYESLDMALCEDALDDESILELYVNTYSAFDHVKRMDSYSRRERPVHYHHEELKILIPKINASLKFLAQEYSVYSKLAQST